jgi:hypothetical protein
MSRITVPLAMAAAILAAGCHSYKPLPAPASAVGRTVKVQFSVPRDLVAVRGATGDSVFSQVSALRGRVVDTVGDTMHVVLQRVTDTALDHPVPPGMTVTIVPAPSVAVDVLAVDEGKTAAFAGGTILVIAVLGVAALIALVATAGRAN